MPSSPFPPRPRQQEPPGVDTPRGILRHDISPTPRPPRSTTPSPYHHHHTSSSPELRPRVDSAWAPRARPDLSPSANSPSYPHPSTEPRPRTAHSDAAKRRSAFVARVSPHLVPGIRGRSASDVRIVHTPPPDLEPDRLARACGHPPPGPYLYDDRPRHPAPAGGPSTAPPRAADPSPSPPPPPKIRITHLYPRLDSLARRAGGHALDYVSSVEVALTLKRDGQLREQLRRKRSDRLQERDPGFHAIGAALDDVLLYASTPLLIGDYQHHLPIVVVACVEELTKTGIYQSGLFRALPSRDRHLQLIDLFDKSPDFGAHFNLRGQAMPDICALLSTFISSLPNPLLDPNIYAALWHWSVKPSVKRQEDRRDKQEKEEEDRRAKGAPSQPAPWMSHADLYFDETDIEQEADQHSAAQILLRFLPSANLSLLIYLCSFFTQLPLCPENGLQLEDVARIFGHRLLGGTVKAMSQRMMMWLLTRWHRISETLFTDTCGMIPEPPPPPPPSKLPAPTAPVEANSVSGLRIEKRKGNRQSSSDDALRHAHSSSSSSSRSNESHEDRGASRKSSGGEDEGDSEENRRRKKRELDKQAHMSFHRSSTRKESRHGHGRRGSGSRRHHHHAHSSQESNVPPDPFAVAFAMAQQDLADAPLLETPSGSPVSRAGAGDVGADAPHHAHRDTPIRVNARQDEDEDAADPRPRPVHTVNVDARIVDALLQERAAATGATRALAERVLVLERALKVRGVDAEGAPRAHAGQAGGGNSSAGSGDEKHQRGVEDGLRLQLQLVEEERDRAQRIVRDMRAYLLDGEQR